MSLISSLPFCVEEFPHMDFVYDKYIIPYFNANGDPDNTGFKGLQYPLALTKEQVHALYWRLISIELDYEVSDSDGNETTGRPVSEAEVPQAVLGNSVDTAILKRVCGGLEYLSYESEYKSTDFITNTPIYSYDIQSLALFDFRTFMSGGNTIRFPRCVKIENAYYPLFEWGDNAYESEVTTFGIEKTTEYSKGTAVTTFLNGPTITLSFPDSSTASFQVFLRRKTQPLRVYDSIFTAGTWNVNLW